MRRLFAAAVLALAAPAAAQEAAGLHSRTLDNGLEVIVLESHAVPLVTIELDVKNGAYTEGPEFDGLSHLYEHMFFKANRTIPSQERYLERMNELGAIWNGTTSAERVNYFVHVGVDSLEPAIQFMEDAIRYPLFLEEELVRERPVVLGEYDRLESDPLFHLDRAVDTLLWTPDYYSRKNAIGDREVLATTPPAKMRTIQERYYVPNNTALILAGDVTAERGFELAERVFGDWPRGADPFRDPVPDPPPLEASRAVVVERPVGTVTVSMKWQGPSVDDDPEATYAADLLARILANPASRFQKALVDAGLATAVGFQYATMAHVGPIEISARTAPESAVALVAAIRAEVQAMIDPGYVDPDELAAAQRQMAIDRVYQEERPSALAHTIGYWWAVADLDYHRGYIDGIEAVTADDLAAFARRWLDGRPHVVGVLVAPEAREAAGIEAADLLPPERAR